MDALHWLEYPVKTITGLDQFSGLSHATESDSIRRQALLNNRMMGSFCEQVGLTLATKSWVFHVEASQQGRKRRAEIEPVMSFRLRAGRVFFCCLILKVSAETCKNSKLSPDSPKPYNGLNCHLLPPTSFKAWRPFCFCSYGVTMWSTGLRTSGPAERWQAHKTQDFIKSSLASLGGSRSPYHSPGATCFYNQQEHRTVHHNQNVTTTYSTEDNTREQSAAIVSLRMWVSYFLDAQCRRRSSSVYII